MMKDFGDHFASLFLYFNSAHWREKYNAYTVLDKTERNGSRKSTRVFTTFGLLLQSSSICPVKIYEFDLPGCSSISTG